MKTLSLYCGAGGIDEGLRQAGYTTTLAVDSDDDACSTFRANHPDAEVLCEDVAKAAYMFGRFDVVVGGPPCPEFSVANAHPTKDPAQVNLFWEIVEKVGAKWWLMENVRGVQAVLGHRTDGKMINCADYGVPQKRLRMIYSNLPVPRPTHAERPAATLDGPPLKKWVSVGDALGLDGTVRDRDQRPGRPWAEHSTGEPSVTVKANPHLLLQDRRHQSGPRDYSVDRPSIVLQTDTRLFLQGSVERKLTLDELAALQGFPASYEWVGNKGSVTRQIGNALPPAISRAYAGGLP